MTETVTDNKEPGYRYIFRENWELRTITFITLSSVVGLMLASGKGSKYLPLYTTQLFISNAISNFNSNMFIGKDLHGIYHETRKSYNKIETRTDAFKFALGAIGFCALIFCVAGPTFSMAYGLAQTEKLEAGLGDALGGLFVFLTIIELNISIVKCLRNREARKDKAKTKQIQALNQQHIPSEVLALIFAGASATLFALRDSINVIHIPDAGDLLLTLTGIGMVINAIAGPNAFINLMQRVARTERYYTNCFTEKDLTHYRNEAFAAFVAQLIRQETLKANTQTAKKLRTTSGGDTAPLVSSVTTDIKVLLKQGNDKLKPLYANNITAFFLLCMAVINFSGYELLTGDTILKWFGDDKASIENKALAGGVFFVLGSLIAFYTLHSSNTLINSLRTIPMSHKAFGSMRFKTIHKGHFAALAVMTSVIVYVAVTAIGAAIGAIGKEAPGLVTGKIIYPTVASSITLSLLFHTLGASHAMMDYYNNLAVPDRVKQCEDDLQTLQDSTAGVTIGDTESGEINIENDEYKHLANLSFMKQDKRDREDLKKSYCGRWAASFKRAFCCGG